MSSKCRPSFPARADAMTSRSVAGPTHAGPSRGGSRTNGMDAGQQHAPGGPRSGGTGPQSSRAPEKTPTLERTAATTLPPDTSCMASSEDGAFLGLGHSGGLTLWSSSSLSLVAQWLKDNVDMASIQISDAAQQTYVLATVDDMGVARLLAFQERNIYLLKVINPTEDINQRSMCSWFKLSKGGDYAAASITCNSAVSLDIYQFPVEAWLREREETQEASSSGSGAAPVSLLLRIKQPKGVDDVTDSREEGEERSPESRTPRAKDEGSRSGSLHFLLPCPFIAARDAKSQPGCPVAVCLWWSGTSTLYQYQLGRAPRSRAEPDPVTEVFGESDMDPAPDALWPNENEILCSAVSRCTSFVALGLGGALVSVWDRLSDAPLRAVLITAADSALCRLHFVRAAAASPAPRLQSAQVRLLVVCKSGVLHTVVTGQGAEPVSVQLTKRPAVGGEVPATTVPVAFLSGVVLVIQRNGKIFLQDVISRSTVCVLICRKGFEPTTPWKPVFALNTKRQTFHIQGGQGFSSYDLEKEPFQLNTFALASQDALKKYAVSPTDCPVQQSMMNFAALEEQCDLYLQQRARGAEERGRAVAQTWRQLKEHGDALVQRHRSRAARRAAKS